MSFLEFIENAIREDIGDGDHTSMACIPQEAEGKARLLVKDTGTIGGVEVASQIFHHIDPQLQFQRLIDDGTQVEPGNIVFYISGPVRSILLAERLVLNCMQRMSGIATRTREIVDKLDGLDTKVLDTRKTTPGIRFLEKRAVAIGGGVNHRMGLYDMMMIKDNHVDYAGGITEAIKRAQKYLSENSKSLKIVVEARDMGEVRKVLEAGGVDRILLDNFDYPDLKQAVELINGQLPTEASGGITLETARQYAECGVDYISIGELTHSTRCFDLSLKAC